MKWSRAMCMADSDGDGFSNGDEMGDPCCTWVEGATPSRTFPNLANPAMKESVSKFPSCTFGGRMCILFYFISPPFRFWSKIESLQLDLSATPHLPLSFN